MKQTTFAQRLAAALVALCMVLSVCAPALAADDRVIWIQKNNGRPEPLNASNIGTKLPGCSYAYDGTTVTITMAASEAAVGKVPVMEGVKLAGGPNTDIVLVCTNNTRMDGGLGLTITGMRNVTIKTADTSQDYTGAFYGALKVTDCHGNVTVTNPHGAAVVYSLDVDNTAGTGNVTITGSNANGPICAVSGGFGNKVNIASNGDVKIENIVVSEMFGTQLNYQAVDGELTVTSSKSVTTTGGASKVDITSTGDVEIKSNDTKNVVGNGLSVNAGGAVTVTGGGASDAAAAIKGDANITAGGSVNVSNSSGIAVDGSLTVNSSTDVTVVGNTLRNAIRVGANITSSGAVNISNSRGIAVGGKLTVKNDSGTGDVTVSGKGGNTVGRGAEITSRGAVNITNTDNTGLAVSGDLTVHDSKRVKVSGGNASAPAVSGDITLTSSGKMELSNPNGQVTSKKLTVKNSTGEVSVTGSKSDGSALVQYGASIDTTGAVTITNSSGPAIFGGLNVSKSGSITVSGDCSGTAISGNSTINSSGKIDLKNTSGPVAGSKLTIQSSGAVDITGNGSSAALNEAEITSDGAVNITSNGGQAAGDKLTVNKSTIVKVIAVKSNYSAFGRTPSFANTEKVEIWNNGSSGRAGVVRYTPPEGMGFAYYTSNVSSAAKQHTHDTDIVTESSYLRIVTDTIYALTLSDGVTATTGGTEDTKFYEGESVTVTAPADTETNKFKEWNFSGTVPTGLPDGWQTSREFTFKMPAGNVTLDASYNTITKYDVKVTGGTIADDTGDTSGIYLPGTKVTVTFTGNTGIKDQFKQWTGGDNIKNTEPTNWRNSETFTFTMPNSAVSLTAEYKTAYTLSVDDGRGSFTVNGEVRTQALEGETVKVKTSDAFFNDHRQFNGWLLSGDSAQLVSPSANWENSETFTFKMPAGNVSLKADCKQLYDLTVEGGTIDGESGKISGIYLPGDEVTVVFTDSGDIAKQFKQWKSDATAPEAPAAGWPEGGWENSETFTFKMPEGSVRLTAVYQKTYYLSEDNSKAEFFVNGKQVNQAPAGTRVTVKLVDGFINDHCEFDQWLPAGGTALVDPEEGWEHKPSFSFTMPEGMVILKAYATFLFDVNVTHGTIVDENGDTGTSQKIVKPGQLVTVRAESTEENPFLRWNSTSKAPEEPDGGWTVENWQTSPEFTFKMPSGNVTLEAQRDQLYKVSIHDSLGNVTINGKPCESLWVKDGDTVTVATTLKDGYSMEFEKWTTGTNSTTLEETPENWQTSTTFTFKMPKGTVDLTASWMSGAIEKPDPKDPNTEPLDPGFTVDPEPAAKTDTAGAALVAAAVGGAAVWGGYEVATRVLLHKLLPEGAAIPKTRAELALLLWNAAGQPEPAAVPAFADVADPETAKAAQWCTEQGCLTVKEPDRFQPDKHVTKYRVIDCWNKAFPAA